MRREEIMTSIMAFIRRRPVLTYYVFTFAISWGGMLLVIGGPGGIPATAEQFERLFPFVMLALFAGPSVSSLLLTAFLDGKAGLRELLARLLRWRVGVRWYAIALLTAPLFYLALTLALSRFSPGFLPSILVTPDKTSLLLMGIVAGLIGGGLLEELGWTGFAVPRLRLRYSVLTTALIVGVLWGAWHWVVIFWMGGSTFGAVPRALFVAVRGFDLLVGQLVAYRVLLVWVHDRTDGSLPVVMLMHASLSASMVILSPMALSGWPFLVYCVVWSAAMWVVAGTVAAVDRRWIARPGKSLTGIGSPQPTPQ
jgi:membrane protease YdiL (CAAX protease family)